VGALFDERTGLPLGIAAHLSQHSHSQVMTGTVVGMATPDSNLIRISHSNDPYESKRFVCNICNALFLAVRVFFLDPRSTHKLEDNLDAI
jgi:hypothetical protein